MYLFIYLSIHVYVHICESVLVSPLYYKPFVKRETRYTIYICICTLTRAVGSNEHRPWQQTGARRKIRPGRRRWWRNTPLGERVFGPTRMYICEKVCTYMYTYIRWSIYYYIPYTYISIYIYIYIYMYIASTMGKYTSGGTRYRTYEKDKNKAHICICTYLYAYMPIYIYTYISIHI